MKLPFLHKEESLVAVDIGASSVKLLELEVKGSTARLKNIGIAPLSGEIFQNNQIAAIEKVGEQIVLLREANSIGDKRIAVAVPGPSAFTKRIRVPRMEPAELKEHVSFEAANFIPHNLSAVHLDFHVIGSVGKQQLDVLVVAVKNEIVDSYLNCIESIGLEVAVMDVDYFAIQNMFEFCYPDFASQTVALINMGSRFSSINICRNGQSLFVGDVPLGGRHFTEAAMDETGLSFADAEALKISNDRKAPNYAALKDALDRHSQYVASEFNRQLSFFWNASGADDGLDLIAVVGGGSEIPGLLEEMSEKTGVECRHISPLAGIETGGDFSEDFLEEIAPRFGVAVGLAIRTPGDRISSSLD